MLTLHHDVTSPAAAVAVLRLQRVVDAGGRVTFSPLDVLGLEIPIPVTPALVEQIDLHHEVALDHGLVLRRPSRQPPTLLAHVVGELAEEAELGASWRWTCLDAYWREDRDLADVGVLTDLGVRAGLDAAAVAARLEDRTAKASLRERMLAQRRRGLGGVPVLELDGTFVPADLPEPDLWHLAGL